VADAREAAVQHERGRPRLEHQRAQRPDSLAQLPGGLQRQAIEQLFDALDGSREGFERVVVAGHEPP
jgi:hypothetical protein